MNELLQAIFARLRATADLPKLTSLTRMKLAVMATTASLRGAMGRSWAAKALIDAGIDSNKAGDLGYTPLHVACMKGTAEMVKLLIGRGADIFALCEGTGNSHAAWEVRAAQNLSISEFFLLTWPRTSTPGRLPLSQASP